MKKMISALLITVMAFSLLAGCTTPEAADPAPPTGSVAPTPSVSAPAASDKVEEVTSRIVVDDTGREIEVPAEINRIVIMSTMPLASVYCMAGGDPDKLVGLTPSSKNAAVTSFLNRVADLEDVSTAFAQGETVNVEELMNLEPDVVFYNTGAPADVTAVEKLETLGIPCVGFSTAIESTIETVSTWATQIGQVLGTEMQAGEIVAYGKEVEKMVMDRVSTIPEAERRSALILTNYTPASIIAAGSTFGRYWLATIGADNVAIGIEPKVSPVSLEQIYEWDPDVIFLNSFSAFTAEDVANGTAVPGHDWTGLTSVQNGEFYKMPLGMYYWFPPCSDSPLSLQWMAQKLYPELFEDLDMDAEIKDFFQRFYGVTLTDEDLNTLYNPPAESAM